MMGTLTHALTLSERPVPSASPAIFACGLSLIRATDERRKPDDKPQTSTAPERIITEIIASLRRRFAALNCHYEAAWTDSWTHRRCEHLHETPIDAAKCAMPYGAGWYVFAVEYGSPRQLNDQEDQIVYEFRFRNLS